MTKKRVLTTIGVIGGIAAVAGTIFGVKKRHPKKYHEI